MSYTSQGGSIYGPNSLLQYLLEKSVALPFLLLIFHPVGSCLRCLPFFPMRFILYLSLPCSLPWESDLNGLHQEVLLLLATDWVLPTLCSRVRKESDVKVFSPRFPPWRVSHVDWVSGQSSPLYRSLFFLPLFPLGVGW